MKQEIITFALSAGCFLLGFWLRGRRNRHLSTATATSAGLLQEALNKLDSQVLDK